MQGRSWYYSKDAKGSWFRLLVGVFVMAHKQHLTFIYSDYYKEWTLKRPEEKKGHNTKLKKNYKKPFYCVNLNFLLLNYVLQ